MAQLSLFLFGALRIHSGDAPVSGFRTQKERALLIYLAVEAQRLHQREALAELLWPERPEGMARATLRQAITGLRRALGETPGSPHFLCVSRETLQIDAQKDLWLDTAAFNAHLRAVQQHTHPAAPGKPGGEMCPACTQHLQAAVELYHGDFLDDFCLDDCPEFEEWATVNREIYFRLQLGALQALVNFYQGQGDYPQALQYAHRQAAMDALREDAQCQLMRLLACCGQRAAALEQYHACRRMLAKELGVKPDVETTRLYEHIRDGWLAGTEPGHLGIIQPLPAFAESHCPSRAHLPHNLPAPLTSFVAREAKLAHIVRLLSSQDCRWLTLTGPGGAGKTRLALQAALALLNGSAPLARPFTDGIWYIPLSDLEPTEDAWIAALAQTQNISLEKAAQPKAALLAALRQRRLLLILDNAEDAVGVCDLLLEILRAAPGVACMVTSLWRLNYQAEFVIEVDGLPYPPAEIASTAEGAALQAQFPAVQLFIERAARLQVESVLGWQEMAHIAQICQLVEGLPLGIEMAAASTSSHTCAQVAEQIRRDLNSLTLPFRDAPSRQRSLGVIFERSWNFLTPAEQATYRQLAVFRGGFTEQAAGAVIGDPHILSHLRRLRDKSLLQMDAGGRYDLHTVLKAFVDVKLAEDRQQQAAVHERHSRYYLQFLRQRAARLKGEAAKIALNELRPELKNLRAAWEWSVNAAERAGSVNEIETSLEALAQCYDLVGLYPEGESIFGSAARRL